MSRTNRQSTMKAAARHAEEADLRPVEGREADAELAQLARALGHPTRIGILRATRRAESSTIRGLVGALGLAQSTVSEHVRVLREAGLLALDDGARRGDYTADVHRLRRLKALVGSL